MPYKVKLEAFEGPLDLLLFLIKKSEVDIYDIPIAAITRQYLEYIEIIQLLDIEAAGDFILIAATLMRIKAQMLLPKPQMDELEDVEDPRQELVYRLLEYKRFKDVAAELAEKEEQSRYSFPRGSFKVERSGFSEDFMLAQDVSLFDLVAAFKKVVETRPKVTIHRVHEFNITLEQQMETVLAKMKESRQIDLEDLFKDDDDKIVLIVTFIAVLELIKQKVLRVEQIESFGRIVLHRNDR